VPRSPSRTTANLSKDYLAGNAPEEWIPLRDAQFYAQNGIEVQLGARVTNVDLRLKSVICANGRTRDFDALLLATGAEPVRLTLHGHDLPHVHYLRSLATAAR